MCAHSAHASVVQESARFYCHAKRSLVKSEGTSAKVGQGVSHHDLCKAVSRTLTCTRMQTHTHRCMHRHKAIL